VAKADTAETIYRQLEMLALAARQARLTALAFAIGIAALEADTECQRLRTQHARHKKMLRSRRKE
jgi:hypothetical protein